MASCPNCTRAATEATWPGYQADCHGCKVRALANGPQFWRSLQDRQRTPGYQAELVAVFGEEGAEAGHTAVLAEYKRLKKLRGAAHEKESHREGGHPGLGPEQSEVYREMLMTETLESIEKVESPQPKRPIGPIVWETILQLANDGRLITRRNLREVTGLSYEQIDECVKRLEDGGKVIKAGGGLIEVLPLYPPERAQSLIALPDGRVKWELADGGAPAGGVEAVFTPPEARRIGMLFAGFARQFEEMEMSNKALMRTAELALEVRQLKRELAALKQPKNDAQMDLLGVGS